MNLKLNVNPTGQLLIPRPAMPDTAQRQLGASITRDGTTKPVKNLGWLLANWKLIHSFDLYPHPPADKGQQPVADLVLVARLREPGVFTVASPTDYYLTGYACLAVCLDFLNRPVFRGLEIRTHGLALPATA